MAKQKAEQVIPPKKRFMDGFKSLCYNRHQYPVWSDLWEIYALTIMNPLTKQLYSESEKLKKVWDAREARYMQIVKRYKKDEMQTITEMFAAMVEELERNPWQDFAGQMYMELQISNKNTGQFFTPYSVCDLAAQVTGDHESLKQSIKDKGWYSIYDCACGGGAMLIAGCEQANREFHRLDWRNHVMCNANDIDIVCCSMCYVQLSLIGVAAIVTQSDALKQACVDFYKEPENVWFTPMYFSEVWTQRRFWHGYDMNMHKNKFSGIRGIFQSLNEITGGKSESKQEADEDADEWDDEEWE